MAQKEKAPKASNEVNDDLVRELSKSFDVSLEKTWWAKARKMVETKEISVRGLKATIKKVEDTFGNAPTLRSSWSQYFEDAYKVEDLEGGKIQSLKSILNVTIQGTRKAKGRDGFAEILESVKSFSELAKRVEDMPKAKSAESDEPSFADIKAAMATADGVVKIALHALRELSGDEATINNKAEAEDLIKVLGVLLGGRVGAKERHPSKVSA